jgi:hypothetical protein
MPSWGWHRQKKGAARRRPLDARRARGIRYPGRWSRVPLMVIRMREPNDARSVVAALS